MKLKIKETEEILTIHEYKLKVFYCKYGSIQVIKDEYGYYIFNFWVSEKYRSLGVGTLLLEKVIEKYGKDYLYLYCKEKMLKFYKKRGFRVSKNQDCKPYYKLFYYEKQKAIQKKEHTLEKWISELL